MKLSLRFAWVALSCLGLVACGAHTSGDDSPDGSACAARPAAACPSGSHWDATLCACARDGACPLKIAPADCATGKLNVITCACDCADVDCGDAGVDDRTCQCFGPIGLDGGRTTVCEHHGECAPGTHLDLHQCGCVRDLDGG